MTDFSNKCECTSITQRLGKMTITHGGGMRNGWHDLNVNLKKLGYSTIDEYKNKFKILREFGHPDYLYELVLKI